METLGNHNLKTKCSWYYNIKFFSLFKINLMLPCTMLRGGGGAFYPFLFYFLQNATKISQSFINKCVENIQTISTKFHHCRNVSKKHLQLTWRHSNNFFYMNSFKQVSISTKESCKVSLSEYVDSYNKEFVFNTISTCWRKNDTFDIFLSWS